jgi:hypothetical protein
LKKKWAVLGVSFFLLTAFPPAGMGEEHPVDIQGTYLVYSYDYNQIYGENASLKSAFGNLTCLYLKADIGARVYLAVGKVVLERDGEILEGDELIFKPHENRGTLVRYGEAIEVQEIGEAAGGSLISQKEILDVLALSGLKNSFIFFTGLHFSVTDRFEVFGYDVTLYIEGLESVGLKKFRLSEGIRQKQNGFFLDKVWFNRSQGIIAQAGLFFEKEDKINSVTRLSYEEHSILKDYAGLNRQLDIMTSTSFSVMEDLNLGIIGNFNTSQQWNAQFLMNKNWGERSRTQVSFSYNKPANRSSETWVGLESFFDGAKLGSVSFSGKYEFQNQILTTFSYGNTAIKNFDFLLTASYSKLRFGHSGDYSKILTGSARLAYRTKIFNLSTDYYLNKDLFGSQLLTQPQLRFGLNTFRLYAGLLSATLTNVFIFNSFKAFELNSNSYSNNSIFSLASQPLAIGKGLDMRFSMSLEQFLEKEGRNFTSGGFIFNAQQAIVKGVALEGFFSVQSRRKTENWFVEGTTSQDLSLILRVNPGESLNSWVSLSYDPKNNQVRQSFADISIGLIKNWRFHSLFNYDFLMKRLNNVDLYLIRDSGRFQIRLIWRSLSKQFLVELIPK